MIFKACQQLQNRHGKQINQRLKRKLDANIFILK